MTDFNIFYKTYGIGFCLIYEHFKNNTNFKNILNITENFEKMFLFYFLIGNVQLT